LAQTLRTDYRTSRALDGNNILPNPLKPPSRNPMQENIQNSPSTDFNDVLNQFKDDFTKSLEESLGIHLKTARNMYTKPYPSTIDYMQNPDGWKVPNFRKFNGSGSKTIMEHDSMYLAQLGEASALDYMKIRNFSLSLTGIAFAWFTSLPPLCINSWVELEEKFHSHFYTRT
jgi:hypothetical protein